MTNLKYANSYSWDDYEPETYRFITTMREGQVVDQHDFEQFIELNDDMPFLDEDETIQDWIEFKQASGDFEFVLDNYKGHTIGAIRALGHYMYFTPNGLHPKKLPEINRADQVIKYVEKEPFDLTEADLPGALVVHGTNAEGIKSIEEHGPSHEFTNSGYLGKCLYTTTNYRYALFNYAANHDNSENKSDSGVVLMKIKPGAKILTEEHPRFGELHDQMSRPDFPYFLKEEGFDGIFVKAFDAIGIHNLEAVDVLASFSSEELLKHHRRALEASSEASL